MATYRFTAGDVPTSDAFYIHFSTSRKDPDAYLVLQRSSTSSPRTTFKCEHGEVDLTGHVASVRLGRESLCLLLDDRGREAAFGCDAIEIAFTSTDEEYAEIRRQLAGILRVSFAEELRDLKLPTEE